MEKDGVSFVTVELEASWCYTEHLTKCKEEEEEEVMLPRPDTRMAWMENPLSGCEQEADFEAECVAPPSWDLSRHPMQMCDLLIPEGEEFLIQSQDKEIKSIKLYIEDRENLLQQASSSEATVNHVGQSESEPEGSDVSELTAQVEIVADEESMETVEKPEAADATHEDAAHSAKTEEPRAAVRELEVLLLLAKEELEEDENYLEYRLLVSSTVGPGDKQMDWIKPAETAESLRPIGQPSTEQTGQAADFTYEERIYGIEALQRTSTEKLDQNGQTLKPQEPAQTEEFVVLHRDEPEKFVILKMEQPLLPAELEESVMLEIEESSPPSQTEESVMKQVERVSPPDQVGNQTADREPQLPQVNGELVDRKAACILAERLYRLDDMRRVDVVKHIDKDNDFSRAVGEEYLKFFDFNGQSLEQSLRSFLKVVVLIGETQERERVLEHFARRFHECSPESFSSPGAVLTLTCAVMLLNTDLHGQNVGKAMSLSSFVSNLDGMNEGENFCKDLLKSLYSRIRSEPLEWAVDETELKSSLVPPGDENSETTLRSKSNPFQDVPHDKKATIYKQGFLTRKVHADIDGKRTPWGKRSWKTFYAVLKGMVLYLQKDEYKMEWHSSEEVIAVHHALAEKAGDYTKRPHVFRLQTADWRVFLFQASSTEQMISWIGRINLVSALFSAPPFPAAVGSQKKFSKPILPAAQSSLTLEKQLESHSSMVSSFSEDLACLHQSAPEGRKAKARELEEHKLREEYVLYERNRYEIYKHMLEVWKAHGGDVGGAVEAAQLESFDTEVSAEMRDMDDGAGMKKSHSSPSLNLELAPPPVVKVKRNISERRTYRKTIVPRRNREL